MGIYIHEIDTSLLKITLLMREKYIYITRDRFKNLLIFVKISMDFEILFFMYLIWSDQFNLLSSITPKNFVLLTFTNFFPQMCTLSSTVLCLIRVRWNII